ncbi:major capsid protein, partial [uncultured marine virus]
TDETTTTLNSTSSGGLFGNTGVSLDPQGGLYADLSTAEAVNINEFRKAFALQRYQEARARYGSRFVDYLAYLGIRSSDSRLQRPEFLGGGKQTIAFSEVLNTTSATQDPGSFDDLGRMGGHGIAALRSNRYRRFFEEHGYIISMLSVRPRNMYVNSLHRSWSRSTKEDFYHTNSNKSVNRKS